MSKPFKKGHSKIEKVDYANSYNDVRGGGGQDFERSLTKKMFQIGAVATLIESKGPAALKSLAKTLTSAELNTLKAAIAVAKKYRVNLQKILADIEANGLDLQSKQAVVDYIKKGLAFIAKVKKRLGAAHFDKLTLNILNKNKPNSLVSKNKLSYLRIDKLIHGEGYKEKFKNKAKSTPVAELIEPVPDAPKTVISMITEPIPELPKSAMRLSNPRLYAYVDPMGKHKPIVSAPGSNNKATVLLYPQYFALKHEYTDKEQNYVSNFIKQHAPEYEKYDK